MNARPSLFSLVWGDLQAISAKTSLAAWAITLPTLTVNAALEKVFGDQKTILDAVVLTWPLTISATFFFILVFRGWLREASKIDIFIATSLLVIGPYLIALWFDAVPSVDRHLTWSNASWIMFLHPVHMAQLVGNIFLYYLSLDDGLFRTFKSLVCGLLLASVFEHVLLPRARYLRDAVAKGRDGTG